MIGANVIRLYLTSSDESNWALYRHDLSYMPEPADAWDCIVIDQVRDIIICSDTTVARIKWRYDRARVERAFSTPRLNLIDRPSTEYYGHTPKGILDEFDALVGDERSPLWRPRRAYENLTEEVIRRHAASLPIEIVSMELSSRY